MTLEQWSIVIFITSVIMYLAAYNSMFNNPTIKKFVVVIIAWAARLTTLVWYGLATNQIGFILLSLFEVIIMFFIYVTAKKEYQVNVD